MSTPALPDLVGEVLDARYEVLEHVADGGMAVVYKALDTRLDREVALKVLKPHLVHDEEFVRRFEREARAAASLQHANIVGVLDYGRDRGHLFIVLEYVAGRTLRQIIDDEGSLTPRAALDLMDPVLDALGQAHRAGLIHRDVKPENVLVREDGVVKVADFGLVRAVTSQTVTSSSSVLLGTVAYVSPEQVARGIADARSDVYSAGLILFELLTGTKAFTGELPVNVAFMHVHEDAPRVSSRAAGTPTALDDAVATAASRDPDARPADALAFRSLLARVRAGLTAAQLDRRLGPSGPRSSADTRGAVGPAASTAALPVAGRAQTTASIPTASSALATTPPSAVARRRRRWPWVLVALSAALLAATLWAFTSGPLEPTPVPKLAGSEVAKAHDALAAVGLTGRDSEAFSEDIPAGVVISSTPTEGTTVWKWNTVDLVVSKGQERYAVPTLAGATLDAGLQALRDAHLSSGTQGQEFSETVPEGSIISSDPVAGTPLPPGGAVNLVVSKGRQPIDVPDFTGKPYADAEAALTAAGLAPTVSEQQNSDTVPKGSVISQQPARGQLFKGDAVTFVVSKGPVLVAVPDVFGKQQGEAKSILEAAGFKVSVEKLLGGVFGTVRSTDPAAGTQVPKGSTVTIRVV